MGFISKLFNLLNNCGDEDVFRVATGKLIAIIIIIVPCHGNFTLMLFESVRNMVRRSIPMPQPAVGGNPYSSAVQNVSSMNMASSSPSALA